MADKTVLQVSLNVCRIELNCQVHVEIRNKGPVLRPRCIGTTRARTELLI